MKPIVRTSASLFIAACAALAPFTIGGCASDDEAKKEEPQGDVGVRLRRATVASGGLDHLTLDVVLLVENGQNADVAVKGGTIEASFVKRIVDEEEPVAEADEEGSTDGEEEAMEAGGEDTEPTDDAEDTEAPAEEAVADIPTEGVVDGSWHKATVEAATAAAYNKTEVVVPLTLPFPTDADARDAFLRWGKVEIAFKGDVQLASGTETISGTRVVGLPSWPTIKVGNVQVSSEQGGTAGEIYITMQLDNENPFDVRLEKYDWNCKIGEKQMREFAGSSATTVTAGSTVEENDTFKLNQETYGPDVAKLLQQPAVPYTIQAFYEVDGVKKEFTFNGEMSFAR